MTLEPPNTDPSRNQKTAQEAWHTRIEAFCANEEELKPITPEELAEYAKQGVKLWPDEEEERNDKS